MRDSVLPVSTQAQEPDKDWRAVAARSDNVSEGSFGGMPYDSGEGAELDGMESDGSDHSLRLEEEDARMHGEEEDDGPLFMKTTRGRDMCACLPCCFFCS